VAEARYLFDDVPAAATRAPLEVHDVVLDPVFGRRRDALCALSPSMTSSTGLNDQTPESLASTFELWRSLHSMP
jgi:hypothetical protein